MKLQFAISSIKSSKRNLSNPIYVAMSNLAESARQLGHEVIFDDDMTPRGDVAFMFGSVTKRKEGTDRAKQKKALLDANIPTFHFDTGLFSVYVRNKMQSSETYMFRMGLDDCVGTGNFLNYESDSTRYDWFKKAFDFEEHSPRSNNNGPILFLLQSEKGWQYDNLEPFWEYARTVIERIRRTSSREIVLRAHPNPDRRPTEVIAQGFDNVSIEYADRGRASILPSIRSAFAVVTHSSSAAIESIVEGVPTYALDERCIAYGAAEWDLDNINKPEMIDWSKRQQHLHDWAYTTWHTDEFANPQVLEYYLKRL